MVTRKNKYFSKRAKSIRKESNLYPDEQNGLIQRWKNWSTEQSADQQMPFSPYVDGKKQFVPPTNEPTKRTESVRRLYKPHFQTNAHFFERSPFEENLPIVSMNSAQLYNQAKKTIDAIQSKMQQDKKNKALAEDTKRKLNSTPYIVWDKMRRSYKDANAVNESSQFYQNMFNPNGYDTRNAFQQKVNIPTKADAQRTQYAWNYNNPMNMYSRANSNVTKFLANQLINFGYGRMFVDPFNPKDVILMDKVRTNEYQD